MRFRAISLTLSIITFHSSRDQNWSSSCTSPFARHSSISHAQLLPPSPYLCPTSHLLPVLPSIRSTLSLLADLGATLSSVSPKTAPLDLGPSLVLASAEASSNLTRYDGTEFGEYAFFLVRSRERADIQFLCRFPSSS